jgi:single-strand DNA-binding protein
MSNGINKVILLGNLGADPELRFTQGGQGVLNIRLCTTTRYKDRDGDWKEREEWHGVVVWGARAEGLSKFLGKGDKVYVEGELRTSSWDDKKSGEKRYKTEIHASEIIPCSGKGNGAGKERDDDRGGDRGRERDDRGGSRGRDDRGGDDRETRGRGFDRPRDDRRDDRRRDARPSETRSSSSSDRDAVDGDDPFADLDQPYGEKKREAWEGA